MPADPVTIRPAGPDDLQAVRGLFKLYAAEADIPAYQNFDRELANLPGAYTAPTGELLVACIARSVIGCVAIRRLDHSTCEMKRLFVDPAARGVGAGAALLDEVLAAARRLGYSHMKLDTDERFLAAVALYRSRGFVECDRYNEDTDPHTRFMVLELDAPP